MKPLSPGKSDRLTKLATMLHAGCESAKGRRRNWLALGAVPSLVLVAVLMVAPPLAAGGDRAFPSWDERINRPERFKVLGDFGGAAVLDKETGLVWERSPDTTIQAWLNAQIHCNASTVGGRMGWRLPTLQEMASLVDPNNPGGNPNLPLGHPFSNVLSSEYWSATTYALNTSLAWVVSLYNGFLNNVDKASTLYVWCVRGGQGVDPQ
jgi:hypothetical protein